MNGGNLHTVHLKTENIPFDDETTRKYLRLGSRSEDREALLEVCRGVFLKYRHIFRPLIRYGIFRIKEKDPHSMHIIFQDGNFFSGKGIFSLLKNSEMASLYVITLGEEADRVIAGLEEENFLDGYMLNAAAAGLIEGARMKTFELIKEEAEKEGFSLTKRFSPGYRGWDLSEQEKLISMLNAAEAGISLTEAFLMLPMKTVSGVYGFNRSN